MLDVEEGACSSAHPMPPLSPQSVPPVLSPQLTSQHGARTHTGDDGGSQRGGHRSSMGSSEPGAEAGGDAVCAAWAAWRGASAAWSHLPNTPAQVAHAQSAANAAAVEAVREGLEAHVLEMLQATCSAKGKWNISAAYAAHMQQGGATYDRQTFTVAVHDTVPRRSHMHPQLTTTL